MKKTSRRLLLAIAGGSLLATQVQAQFDHVEGDLLLFFRASGGLTDVGIDLGPASTYLSAGSTPITINQFNLSDLTSTFGGDLSGVLWSAGGGDSTTANLYISRARTSDSVQSAAWLARSPSQLNGTVGEVLGVGNRMNTTGTDFGGGSQATALSSGDSAGYTQNMLNASSIPNW